MNNFCNNNTFADISEHIFFNFRRRTLNCEKGVEGKCDCGFGKGSHGGRHILTTISLVLENWEIWWISSTKVLDIHQI